jgi:hypothetical protein
MKGRKRSVFNHILRVQILRITVAVLIAMTAAEAFAADKVIYQLDWLPSGEETFPYVAQKGGYFAAANLDVEIRIGRGTTMGYCAHLHGDILPVPPVVIAIIGILPAVLSWVFAVAWNWNRLPAAPPIVFGGFR